MQFPRKSMKTMELVKECGFKRSFLIQIAHMEGQKCATRLPGGRDIYWDTDKLGRQLEKLSVR